MTDRTLRELPPAPRYSAVHLRSLTGWRFVAALFVFLSHVREYLFSGLAAIALGGPAVSLFFVLSGFILTYVYDARLKRIGVRKFYVTRFGRLWPLHVACLLICLWLVSDFVTGDPLNPNSPPSFLAQLFLVHAWIPVRNWMFGFNSVSWSISTEFFFYLVFPLFLRLSRRWLGISFLMSFAGTLAVLAILNNWQAAGGSSQFLDWKTAVICNPLIRLPEFLLGMVACRYFFLPAHSGQSIRRGTGNFWADSALEILSVGLLAGLLAIVLRYNLLVTMYAFPGPVWATWLRVAGGMFLFGLLIVVFARCRGVLSLVMSSRLLVWLGEISYAFYLIHQIMIRTLRESMFSGWQLVWYSFALSLFAAALLYRLVEMPGKFAILSAWEGDRRKAAKQVINGLQSLVTTPAGLLQLGGFVATVVLIVAVITPTAFNDREIARIIAATPPPLRDIEFEDEAVLLGFEVQQHERGRILRLVWQLKSGFSRPRFVHITGPDGEIMSQVSPNDFRRVSAGRKSRPFIDEVRISRERTYQASSIGIGFWSADLSGARMATEIVAEHVQLGGYRLQIDKIKQRNWK